MHIDFSQISYLKIWEKNWTFKTVHRWILSRKDLVPEITCSARIGVSLKRRVLKNSEVCRELVSRVSFAMNNWISKLVHWHRRRRRCNILKLRIFFLQFCYILLSFTTDLHRGSRVRSYFTQIQMNPPSVSFSPESGGSVNPSRAMEEISTQGTIKLKK